MDANCLLKMVNYEEERLCLIKIDPVQEFPGNNLSRIFLTSLTILGF